MCQNYVIMIYLIIILLIKLCDGQIIDFLYNPVTYHYNQPIIPNNATFGTVTSPSSVVALSLPDGLSLDERHSIVGTPTKAMRQKSFVIRSTASGVIYYAQLFITVVQSLSISYSSSTLTLTKDTAMSNLVPTLIGNDTTISITPPLPTGLSINQNTGIISGTPTIASLKQLYAITISSHGESSFTTLEIEVIDPNGVSLASLEDDISKIRQVSDDALASASAAVSGVFLASIIGVVLIIWLYRRTERDARVNPDDIAHLVREAQGQSISVMTQNAALSNGGATVADIQDARSKRPENLARTFSRANENQSVDGFKLQAIPVTASFTRSTPKYNDNDDDSSINSYQISNNDNYSNAQGAVGKTELEKLLISLDIPLKHCQPLISEDIQVHQLKYLTASDMKVYVKDSKSRKKLWTYIQNS